MAARSSSTVVQKPRTDSSGGVADGATAVALAGWGGGVTVTPTDASCFGGLTFGWVLTNGQFCIAGLEN